MLCGKGTFGQVHYKDGFATKTAPLFRENIVDSNLREAIFYSYLSPPTSNLTSALLQPPPPASIARCADVSLDLQYTFHFKLPYYGVPIHKYKLSRAQLIECMQQLLQGLEWLHARGWSHGDLKPSNVLVQANPIKCTLIDFGSIHFGGDRVRLCHQRCTIYYVSPEELMRLEASSASDMWSFGAMLYELLTGHTFILQFMQFMQVSNERIEQFRHACVHADNKDTFNPKAFLCAFFKHDVMYSHILAFLQQRIKDRAYQSVLGHCFLLDSTQRITARKLLSSGCFACAAAIPVALNVMDVIETYRQTISPIREEYMESRLKIVTTLLKLCKDDKHLGEEVFFHALTLFDRYSIRPLGHKNSSLQHALALIFCAYISGMILRGTYVSCQSLLQHIVEPDINPLIVQLKFVQFLRAFGFRLYNSSPDLLYAMKCIAKKETPKFTDQQGMMTAQTALQYLWHHDHIVEISEQIFER